MTVRVDCAALSMTRSFPRMRGPLLCIHAPAAFACPMHQKDKSGSALCCNVTAAFTTYPRFEIGNVGVGGRHHQQT